jgi:hypothetical protein
MNVLVKCFVPEYYDAADSAVIEVTENLILMLDKRLAQAKAMNDNDFYGTKWWDYTPYFIPTSGPDSVGLEMNEEDFERDLESNGYMRLADDFKEPEDMARMDCCTLTVSASGFGWTAIDKYIGSAGIVETYEQGASVVDEWAELIGFTEKLAKVRACRGEEKKEVSC